MRIGRIGFQDSSPTTNAHHASIWDDLNEAQKDAELKLKHYLQFTEPVAPADISDKQIIAELQQMVAALQAQIAEPVQGASLSAPGTCDEKRMKGNTQ